MQIREQISVRVVRAHLGATCQNSAGAHFADGHGAPPADVCRDSGPLASLRSSLCAPACPPRPGPADHPAYRYQRHVDGSHYFCTENVPPFCAIAASGCLWPPRTPSLPSRPSRGTPRPGAPTAPSPPSASEPAGGDGRRRPPRRCGRRTRPVRQSAARARHTTTPCLFFAAGRTNSVRSDDVYVKRLGRGNTRGALKAGTGFPICGGEAVARGAWSLARRGGSSCQRDSFKVSCPSSPPQAAHNANTRVRNACAAWTLSRLEATRNKCDIHATLQPSERGGGDGAGTVYREQESDLGESLAV